MSVVQNPLIGSARNKVGGVIFQRWKNKNVLRTKPLTVANPDTLPQQKQRTKMTYLVGIMRLLQASLLSAFREMTQGMTAPNAFIGANMQALTVNDSLVVTVNDGNFVAAKGTLLPGSGGSIEDSTVAGFEISWDDNSNGSTGLSTDQANVTIVNFSTGNARSFTPSGVTRADEGCSINLTGIFTAGQEVSIYLYFTRPSVNKSSDSVIVATTTLS